MLREKLIQIQPFMICLSKVTDASEAYFLKIIVFLRFFSPLKGEFLKGHFAKDFFNDDDDDNNVIEANGWWIKLQS